MQCEQPLADGQDANMGIGLTAHIVLALGRRGLGAIRMLQCNHMTSEIVSYQHGKHFIYLALFRTFAYNSTNIQGKNYWFLSQIVTHNCEWLKGEEL